MNLGSLAISLMVTVPLCAADWNLQRAADYLDLRQQQWSDWAPAQRSGGPCISCHTGVTYLLARPALAAALQEKHPTKWERVLVDGVIARVTSAEPKTMFPGATSEAARTHASGVEVVLSVLALAGTRTADAPLSKAEAAALDRLWSQQMRTGDERGAWQWFLLNIHPYESEHSDYFGAVLMATALPAFPREYREQTAVKQHLQDLASYLRREFGSQPLHNRLLALTAADRLPGAVAPGVRERTLRELWAMQREDGGWTIESLGPWKARAAAPQTDGSSAYATAIAAYAVGHSGTGCSDPRLQNALDWLASKQDPDSGKWWAISMNKAYPADSMQSQFMNDAATGFAVLALTQSLACKETSSN